MAAPARNPLHLRVGSGADDDGKTAFLLCPADDAVDPLNERAGGIDDVHPLLFQRIADGLCHG